MKSRKEMKKVTLALLFLCGLTALTGCGIFDDDDDDDTSPPVTGEVAKFSDLAGTYSGKLTGRNCSNNDITFDTVFNIQSSDATTTTINVTIDGLPTQAEAFGLTGSSFQYTDPGALGGTCGDGRLSGTCTYTATSLNCTYSVDGNASATGNINLNRG